MFTTSKYILYIYTCIFMYIFQYFNVSALFQTIVIKSWYSCLQSDIDVVVKCFIEINSNTYILVVRGIKQFIKKFSHVLMLQQILPTYKLNLYVGRFMCATRCRIRIVSSMICTSILVIFYVTDTACAAWESTRQ